MQELEASLEKYEELSSESRTSRSTLEAEVAELRRRLAEVTRGRDPDAQRAHSEDDLSYTEDEEDGRRSAGTARVILEIFFLSMVLIIIWYQTILWNTWGIFPFCRIFQVEQ